MLSMSKLGSELADAALRSELPTTARFVLVAWASFVGVDGEAWPSESKLARLTGLTERSVRRAVKDLTAAGVLVDLGPAPRNAKRRRADLSALARYTALRTQSPDSESPGHTVPPTPDFKSPPTPDTESPEDRNTRLLSKSDVSPRAREGLGLGGNLAGGAGSEDEELALAAVVAAVQETNPERGMRPLDAAERRLVVGAYRQGRASGEELAAVWLWVQLSGEEEPTILRERRTTGWSTVLNARLRERVPIAMRWVAAGRRDLPKRQKYVNGSRAKGAANILAIIAEIEAKEKANEQP